MGRKSRRGKHNSKNHDDTTTTTESDDDESSPPPPTTTTKTNFKELDYAQRQELKRQQAAAKRKSKQRCFLCGKTGHVRRECPGVDDDGRGMSKYK
eukprot:CAMPEP_0185734952 /NCGR_PEP_ID=MMETSP1171-20130828/23992_1 /TAXON_ID=374046 /ORGANISM="Helicotheca tamensis, Strain CCMP826" /LENGTH=95 /DNA_ID=CAMNT_0028405103 /DNA_START=34 /DNA_END=318 /DNA_ORIENTATION=-